MAFNLNKGEDKTAKFNLSKSGDPNEKGINQESSGIENEKISERSTQEKGKSKLWLGVLIAAALGLGGWLWYSNGDNANSSTPDTVSANGSTTAATPGESTTGATTLTDSTANSISQQQESVASSSSVTSTQAASQDPSSNDPNNTSERNQQPTASTTTATIEEGNKVVASFQKASASVSNVNEASLKKILAHLKKNPTAKIDVNGYASSDGSSSGNQALSQERANAFKNYLIRKGIKASQVAAIGKGTQDPIGSNETEEGRAKNRRVEFSLE